MSEDANREARSEQLARPPVEVSQILEHLFRDEAGKMVATLTAIFGVEHLALAEDVVQEALARALQTWPYYGVPQNPSAWIMRTARNLALDFVRRQKVFREKEAGISRLMEEPGRKSDEAVFSDQEIADDRLRLMFVCCHPAVSVVDQVALALKTLCGFSVGEVSRALLSTHAATAKRLTRAKQRIREARVPFAIPAGEELRARLDAVLQALYLLFNEGYKATSGDKLVREGLCREAIRLAGVLNEHSAGDQPKTHALLALMLLNAARLPARVDGAGNLLRLQEQDRTRWDRAMIARGMFHFAQSAAGEVVSEYHLEAGIAACHCAAGDYESTDWGRILALYDHLMEFDPTPIVALNRAVAIAKVHGPAAGIAALDGIRDRPEVSSYHLFYAVLGELSTEQGNLKEAKDYFQRAQQLTELNSERQFLSQRIRSCEEGEQARVAVSA